MSDPKCARHLLEAAQRDVLTLRNMTELAPDESFGFHVQQAAEGLGPGHEPIDRDAAVFLVAALVRHVRDQLADIG